MAVLDNRSGFPAELFPVFDATGRTLLVVVVKGTFAVSERGEVAPAPDQAALVTADTHRAEPGRSSLLHASDLAPAKPGTDIVLLGHAWAAQDRAVTRLEVGLRVGGLTKRLLVQGDRVWRRRPGGAVIGDPAPFVRMPLTYERAFGGSDASAQPGDRQEWEPRNPVGRGFCMREPPDGTPLPNIEDPASPITAWSDRPAPQGTGYIDPAWQPRRSHAGTYDDDWRKQQAPLPPRDLDYRFFRAAHPDLCAQSFLRGDETVRLIGFHPDGTLDFALPGIGIGIGVHPARYGGRRMLACLDTIVLLPEQRRLHLVWRCALATRKSVHEVGEITAFAVALETARRLFGTMTVAAPPLEGYQA